MILVKICKKCQQEKQLFEFYNSLRCKHGVSTVCKVCVLSNAKLSQNKEKQKIWKKNNEDKIKIYKLDYQKTTIHRIIKNLRKRIENLNVKFQDGYEMIGCPKQKFKEYLESLFQEGMTWDNYGLGKEKWMIDHIKPFYLLDKNNTIEIKQFNHYTNLCPLWYNNKIIKNKLELQESVKQKNIIKSQRINKKCPKCKELKNIKENFDYIEKTKIYQCYCKECIKIVSKEYYQNNKSKYINTSILYIKNRKKNDINFKLLNNIRSRINTALKKNIKSSSSIELLGCSIAEARKHLESKFKEGMSWENHGMYGWNIDHIRPCASFDMSKPEQQKACFHYTNLQPLWATTKIARQFGDMESIGNTNKGDKIL